MKRSNLEVGDRVRVSDPISGLNGREGVVTGVWGSEESKDGNAGPGLINMGSRTLPGDWTTVTLDGDTTNTGWASSQLEKIS